MFTASQRRRRFIVGLPGIAAGLMALMGFFAMQDDELETADTWRTIFFVGLVIMAISLFLVVRTPKKTKKRQRLDAEPVVPSHIAAWYLEHRKQGKVSIPYYSVVVASADNLYISSDVQKNILKVLNEIHAEQRLIPMIEQQYSKGFTKMLKKIPVNQIAKIQTSLQGLSVTTNDGETQFFPLSDKVDMDEVAMTVANFSMPGIAGYRVMEEHEAGVVRKKTIEHESLIFDRSSVTH